MLHHRLILSGLIKALSPEDPKGPDIMAMTPDIPVTLGELLAQCSREVPADHPPRFDLEVVKLAFAKLSPPSLVIPEVIARLTPQTWTQYQNARDSDGNRVDPDDPCAIKWCLLSAIQRTCTVGVWYPKPTVDAIYAALSSNSIVSYNDTTGRTLKEIHKLLKKAATLSLIS